MMVTPYKHFDLTSFMTKIKNDFQTQQENWCDIRHFQFTNGYYSEYANTHYGKAYMEQYYILKFFPFYFEECMNAYVQFLQSYDKSTLKVLSIGVGNGVDYLALKELIRANNLNIDLDYVGVDIIDWRYRDEDINFIHEDILTLGEKYFQNIDLVIFPKSLIELDEVRINYISDLILSEGSNEIHFLNTYVKKGDHVSGQNEFKLIHKHLIEDGYVLIDNESNRYYTFNDNSKISYPIQYNMWKKPLESYCCGRCGENEAYQCNLAQYPMMYKNNMAFNVLKYIK